MKSISSFRCFRSFPLSAGLLLFPALAPAATLVPSLADGEVRSNGTFETSSYQSRVGEYFFPGGVSFVLPFQLPTLPVGESFATANLRFQLFGKTEVVPPNVGVDLYGLGRRSSDVLLASDYYSGTLDLGSTLLKDDLVTPSTALGVMDTDNLTDAALVNYLNAQYAGGAGAGQYVFLRFSYADDFPDQDMAYYFLTQDAGGATERPEFTYTTTAVPEARTLALIAGAIGMAMILRKRG
ncbi:MAG: hypothetical protein EOP87_26310 [Verrucomicrobiaceae bacterium]|nr:MAG: hypothetical protein EOP87_26310 [Verrucomicrobiaceae bacterium]